MTKRKHSGDRGWNSLPWKTTQVNEGALGEADDCFVFTIEELDGSDYVMERDAVGGLQVKRGKKASAEPSSSKKAKVVKEKDQEKGKPAKKKQQKQLTKDNDDEEEGEEEEDGQEPMDVEEIEMEEVEVNGDGEDDGDDEDDGEGDEQEGGEEAAPSMSAAATKRAQKRKERKERWKKAKQAAKLAKAEQQQQQQDPSSSTTTTAIVPAKTTENEEYNTHNGDLLPAWSSEALDGVSLHPLLLRNLARQGFPTPTPIQRFALPAVMGTNSHQQGKDVMGAAETGSGKTLAYGLPILDFLLKRRDNGTVAEDEGKKGKKKRPLQALILCPTRELAMQVTAHLQEMILGDHRPGREHIKIVSIVGGLSDQKQERLLSRQPEVVVATLGRLWELISSNDPHLKDMAQLRFLVLDEADRMVEDGHYPELDKLMERLMRQQKQYRLDYEKERQRIKAAKKKQEEEDEEEVGGQGKDKAKRRRKKGGAVEEDDEEGGDDDMDLTDGLMVPPEVPVMTIDDIRKEARRLGLKGLHGLVEDEEEDDDDDDGDDGGGDDLKGIIIGGGMKEVRGEDDEDDDDEEEDEEEGGEGGMTMDPPAMRQTLIFSATLSMDDDAREAGSKKKGKKQQQQKKKNKKDKGGEGGGVIAKIMRQVGMRGRPAIIDLSADKDGHKKNDDDGTAAAAVTTTTTTSDPTVAVKKAATASTAMPVGLKLTYIKTVGGEKDVHLYYFLRQYPGRTIIFTNSIDQAKRIAHLLQILKLPARALHAKMQQRQRLKSLDHFKSTSDTILVATDVAARGLDIPVVEHVIHYDLPRSLEVFVHRSGRTARANKEGLSFSLVGPRDEKMHQEICKVLMEDGTMPVFPIDLQYLSGARDRVNLAGRIVGYEQEVERKKSSQNWFLKSAKEADLELDDDLRREEEEDSAQDKQRKMQVAKDRERLAELLDRPLVIERRKFLVDAAERLRAMKEGEEGAKGAGGGKQASSKNKATAVLQGAVAKKKAKQ